MESFVLLIATGGTIACTANADGALVPSLSAEDLVHSSGTSEPVRVYDALRLDSSAITFADIDKLRSLTAQALQDPQISGIVISHGTDSMAETAFALDIVHDDPRPIVLTGAQHAADHEHPDGPGNLAGAIAAAADPLRRNNGVLLHFGGDTLPARGLLKRDTHALEAFTLSSERPLPRPAALARKPLAAIHIPILRAWPGADGEIVDAVTSMNPDGIVIEALGSGNVGPGMGEAITRALDSGIPVVITSSVPYGEVTFAYGGTGGGATLGSQGAIAAGFLRAGQARIALATALANGVDPASVF